MHSGHLRCPYKPRHPIYEQILCFRVIWAICQQKGSQSLFDSESPRSIAQHLFLLYFCGQRHQLAKLICLWHRSDPRCPVFRRHGVQRPNHLRFSWPGRYRNRPGILGSYARRDQLSADHGQPSDYVDFFVRAKREHDLAFYGDVSTFSHVKFRVLIVYLNSTMCNLYMQLGARGVSVMFASGDGGVSGLQLRACKGKPFMPTFPSTWPSKFKSQVLTSKRLRYLPLRDLGRRYPARQIRQSRKGRKFRLRLLLHWRIFAALCCARLPVHSGLLLPPIARADLRGPVQC